MINGYLIKQVQSYRFSTEEDANRFIEEMKSMNEFEVIKSTVAKKNRKEKKEIVDEWIHVDITENFNDEKEPFSLVEVSYEVR